MSRKIIIVWKWDSSLFKYSEKIFEKKTSSKDSIIGIDENQEDNEITELIKNEIYNNNNDFLLLYHTSCDKRKSAFTCDSIPPTKIIGFSGGKEPIYNNVFSYGFLNSDDKVIDTNALDNDIIKTVYFDSVWSFYTGIFNRKMVNSFLDYLNPIAIKLHEINDYENVKDCELAWEEFRDNYKKVHEKTIDTIFNKVFALKKIMKSENWCDVAENHKTCIEEIINNSN